MVHLNRIISLMTVSFIVCASLCFSWYSIRLKLPIKKKKKEKKKDIIKYKCTLITTYQLNICEKNCKIIVYLNLLN